MLSDGICDCSLATRNCSEGGGLWNFLALVLGLSTSASLCLASLPRSRVALSLCPWANGSTGCGDPLGRACGAGVTWAASAPALLPRPPRVSEAEQCASRGVALPCRGSPPHRVSPRRHYPACACLTPLCSLHGAAVTTVEGVGSTRTRLHPVQVSGVRERGRVQKALGSASRPSWRVIRRPAEERPLAQGAGLRVFAGAPGGRRAGGFRASPGS